MIYVVGSGLSGMATALALSGRGYRPTILDAGLKPDSAARGLKARLASTEPEDWNTNDITLLKHVGAPAANGIPRKLHFGSVYPYHDLDPATSPELTHASLYRSFALGGFSNVWGSVIQPFPEKELSTWPIHSSELTPHYAAIRRLFSEPRAPDCTLRSKS